MDNEESQEEMLVRIKGEANPMALGREHNKQHNYRTHSARIEAFGYLMRRQTENCWIFSIQASPSCLKH